ncbi:MAG: transcription antitermination factor NusB [Treponema sp.]|jgi:N utilization substance protein B|nr:transcription antitermination factor NusB [Treponema sp.]
MGSRRRGRVAAFQAIYAMDMTAVWDRGRPVPEELLALSWLEETERAALGATADFFRLLLCGAAENRKAVDALIRKHLAHWDFSRLNRVDRALLRLGVYELMNRTAPPSVIIDEAIDISREYGTDESYRFVNGVLDGVRKTMESENRADEAETVKPENRAGEPETVKPGNRKSKTVEGA